MNEWMLVADWPGYETVLLVLGEPVSVGRKNCAINVSHKKVSRQHITVCLESVRPPRVVVRDLSTNGAYIRGVRVPTDGYGEKQAEIQLDDALSLNHPSRETVSAMMGDEVCY